MVRAIKNSIMMKGLKQRMRHNLNPSNIIFSTAFVVLSVTASFSFADTGKCVIRAVLVKDSSTVANLVKETKRIVPSDSDVELNKITNVIYNNNTIFLVPAKVNGEDNRGCYLFSFDKNIHVKQKIILSQLEDLESCEIITAVFSCNRENNTTSGVGVLYGKRLGADHYWFEGSYLTLDSTGVLNDDKKLSGRLTDVDTVLKAKKKLGCR
jgi:hypothetical protein